ncbi:Fc.00g040220.m01.CDS01 [Cosmosporella sp. VM-42]
MSKPKNWPESFPYLRSPLHSRELTSSQLQTLRTNPSTSIPIIPTALTLTPSPIVKIHAITMPSHPANGQHGLFATQNLKPGTFILPYLGRVHPGTSSASDSDYDLWLDREADVAVDAAREGNEARFVNDYRGVKERANAEFSVGWCERWGELVVGFWVLKGGKGVRKGEEILVSYGKGFWGERRAEDEVENWEGDGEEKAS